MSKIIAFSGKKQSGKNSCANFLVGNFLMQTNQIKDFIVNEESKGELIIKTMDDKEGIFKIDDRKPEVRSYLEDQVYPFIRPFSLANPLKDATILLFGLDPNLVYGTDADKNTLTQYKWEQFYNLIGVSLSNEYPNTGHMTIRDIQKFFGTDALRNRIDPHIHFNRTIEQINQLSPDVAYILDVRFPDEVENIKKSGGKVIRLTRQVYEDNHSSEIALDQRSYDWNNFDAILDNQNMTMAEMFVELLRIIDEWGWL